MNVKFGLLTGAAIACVVMTGCKAPKAQVAAQPTSAASQASVAEKPAPKQEQAPAPAKAAEAPKPASCKCAPGSVHAAPCECGAADCKCKVQEPEPEYTVYRIKGGDMLSAICARYGLSQKKILELNPGLDANKLYVGKTIKLPGKVDVKDSAPAAAPAAKSAKKCSAKPAACTKSASFNGATKEYVVKSGDTLGKIAYSNGITIKCLKDMNGLKKSTIRIGQKLKVPAEKVAPAAKPASTAKAAAPAEKSAAPAPAETAKPAVAEEAPAAPAPAEAEAAPAPAAAEANSVAAEPVKEEAPAEVAAPAASTLTHTVKPGEDTVSIAIMYGVSPSTVMDLNDLKNTDELTPGQVLKLPANAKAQ